MATRRRMERLFAQAVALYHQGEVGKAAALFRIVAAAGGALAVRAQSARIVGSAPGASRLGASARWPDERR